MGRWGGEMGGWGGVGWGGGRGELERETLHGGDRGTERGCWLMLLLLLLLLLLIAFLKRCSPL